MATEAELELEAEAAAIARKRFLDLQRSKATQSPPSREEPEIRDASRPGMVGKALDWLGQNVDPVFSRTKGVGIVPQGFIQDGQPVIESAEQESGVTKLLADILETGAGVAGGATGAVGGNAAIGPAGGYVGAGLGFEAARAPMTQFTKALGLRPDTPENSWEAQKEQMPQNIALDLAIPKVLQGAAKVAKVPVRAIEQKLTQWGTDLKFFRDKGVNLARAVTDKPRAFDRDWQQDILKVPEILEGVDKLVDSTSLKNPLAGKDGFENPFELMLSNIKGTYDPKTGVKTKMGVKDYVGQAVEQTLSQIPDKVKLKDLGLQSIEAKARKVSPEISTRGARSVWDLEINQFAERALPEKEYLKYIKAKDAVERFKALEARASATGKQIDPDDLNKIRQQAKVAKSVVAKAEAKVFNSEFSAVELRELKTKFDSNARYNRLTTPDNFADTRAGIYRDFGNVFRKNLDTLVERQGKETHGLYKQNMEKYGILSDLEPLLEGRAAEAKAKGPYFQTGSFDASQKLGVDKSGLPIIGSLVDKATEVALPQKNIPLARLQAGMGLRPNAFLSMLDTTLGIAGGSMRGAKGLLGGIDRGLSADSLTGRAAPIVTGTLQSQAFAEQQSFPRDSQAIMQNKEAFIERLVQETGDVGLAQSTFQALQLGNEDVARQVMSQLAKQVPQLFTPSEHPSEFDGMIVDPMEKELFTKRVREMRTSGKVSAKEAARQLSALNSGGRVLIRPNAPITPPPMPQQSPLPSLAGRLSTAVGDRRDYDY